MKKIFYPFIIIQSLIILFVYIFESILYIDIAFEWFHYSIIIIDFIFILIITILNQKNLIYGDYCLILGIVFTLIADFILIIIGDYQPYGVSFFIGVQTCYFLYIYRNYKKSLIIIPIVFAIVLLIHLLLHNIENYNIYVCIVYGILFITNIISSFIFKEKLIYKLGLILFFFCDICVAIDGLQPFNDPHSIIFRLIWVFYLPSQVLISTFIYLQMKRE